MKRILKPWSILALAGLLWSGGMSAVGAENVPKLPVEVHDTVFYDNFNDEADLEDWLVVDANEDGNSWNWVSGSGVGSSACLQYRGNGRTPDDWAISPVFALESGRTYKLNYFYNNLYYNEKVEIYLGTGRETASMDRMLSSQDVTTYGWASTVFSVEESGNYCLGIRAASEAVTMPGLYIDEVSVCEEILSTVPGPVQDLTQVPGENGALTMGLSWTNPSEDEAGNTLQSLSGIEIYKNYGNDNIAGSLNLQAGAQVTWTDPDPQPGKVVYHVYAVNASGRSAPMRCLCALWAARRIFIWGGGISSTSWMKGRASMFVCCAANCWCPAATRGVKRRTCRPCARRRCAAVLTTGTGGGRRNCCRNILHASSRSSPGRTGRPCGWCA